MRTSAPDRRFQAIVRRVLTIGITTSSLCFGAGLVLKAAGFERVAGVLLSLGLLMLLTTPAARLAIAAGVYTRQREWLFAGFTLLVIAELLASVLAAL